MKVTEFLGKKVLDKNAIEVGKVADMEIDPIGGVIKSLIISRGELSLKQKTFVINIDEIERVGDYVIISTTGEEAEEILEAKEEPITIQLEKKE